MKSFVPIGRSMVVVLSFLLAIWGVGATTGSYSPQYDNLNRVNQLRSLKVVDLKVAKTVVHAWIMDNESKREEGMMFLRDADVKSSQGMLFVFPDVQTAQNSFWMHNCPMGLDIIYIDAHKRVVNVGDGKPQNDDQVKANRDYNWVLEVKRGWSKKHGLHAGDKIGIPDSLKTGE